MLEWLKEILGDSYTDEVDSKVTAALKERYVLRSDFADKEKELNAAKTALGERDKQLETLRSATGDAEALRKQISDLQAENAQKEQAHLAEMAAFRLDTATERALSAAGAKNTVAAKALLAAFLKDAKVSEDGTVQGLTEAVDKLRTGEDTAFLFDAPKAPKLFGAVPAGSAAGGAMGGYETQLADARKNGNNAQAVAIINAAAREGIQLI